MATFAPNLNGTSIHAAAAAARPKKPLSQEQMAMREWALGEDGRNQDESTVLLHVSHSNLKKTFFQEIRLNMHSTIVNVKHKLEFHTGTSATSAQVSCLVFGSLLAV
jgi:hypothetical protein